MAFESLTDKLQNVFKKLRSKGKLTEADVRASMKEVKLALLEADVNFRVVKDFVKTVEERAVGADVMNGLNPGQMVIKIVNEELTSLMGEGETSLVFAPGKSVTVIMMCGLNGAGKTTTTAKLAKWLKTKSKKSLLAACDVYRPAAVKQLEINAAAVESDVFKIEGEKDPVKIAAGAYKYAEEKGYNVVLLDTAGRLEVDEELMAELKRIKEAVTVHDTILVADACTGQSAVDVAKGFDDSVGIDGVILTKLDSDARGGAALSIKAVTGKPVFFVGISEKMDGLDVFYPDRMASRILGMGDVLSLIEKAAENVDMDTGEALSKKVKSGKFDFNDYLDSMAQMNKMGGLSSIIGMLPGMNKLPENAIDEKILKRNEAIIHSMTKEERSNPKLLNPRRKMRIAKGSGVDIMYVNRLVKQFEEMQKMMKRMPGLMKGSRFGGMNLSKMMQGMKF
ncbi:MAG: signal recognition particle protein [Lachnospiraceae bacterium]|nr:signal recognition particle protein [Lachnospiraceae bacterium]